MERLVKLAKIIILAPSFHPNKGGVEKHLEYVVKNLIDRGNNVTVLVRYSAAFPKKQHIFGADIRRMPKNTSIYSMKLWLVKNKKLFEGSVIHSHDFFPFALRKLLPNVRWVHTFHGYEGYPLDPNAIKSRQEVASMVDYTYCVGSFIEKWYGTKCNSVIWGAANKPPVSQSKIQWDFIFYGRFERDTGFEEYLKAFKLIQNKKPNARMLAVGSGSKLEWAKQYIKENGLNISFHDKVNDINELLHQSKVAFVSGYLSIIECGLAKKPIVAYYGTPIKKDYLECHPMAKYFYIVNSIEGTANSAISALDGNAKQVERLYNWSSKQTWDNIVVQYEKSYQS